MSAAVAMCLYLSQPCVCTRELCVFAFQTLGVMADAAEAIATDADVSCNMIMNRDSRCICIYIEGNRSAKCKV